MIKINCPKCNYKADVMHLHWEAISCLRCNSCIENPINAAIKQIQYGFTVDNDYKSFFLNMMEKSVIELVNQLKEEAAIKSDNNNVDVEVCMDFYADLDVDKFYETQCDENIGLLFMQRINQLKKHQRSLK